MAVVSYGLNDPETVKLWGKVLYAEVIEEVSFAKFMGEGPGNIVQIKTELNKDSGDRVRCFLRGTINSQGKAGSETLKGDEDAYDTFEDDLIIDEQRNAVKVKGAGTIEAQRVNFNLREEAKDVLKQWWADVMDTAFFNQVCANVQAGLSIKVTGLQPVPVPDTDHVFRPNAVANDQTLGAGDKFTLDIIDRVKERAMTMKDRTGKPLIKPITIKGEPMFVLFIHDFQETDLFLDATTAGNWYDIQQAAIMGSKISGNGIFTGALGVYKNVVLHKSTRVPTGANSGTGAAVPTCRRAAFCGAQSAWAAFGQQYSQQTFRWNEEIDDYGKELGVAATTVWGLKRSQFSTTGAASDFGTIIVPTFAQLHS